ncbi:MAG TPA: kelch repeat-containing protein [Thermoanaerobaculia bacterium]|nr:kelch repeat-containing protein [Thermoanaerobaculia bacterium]
MPAITAMALALPQCGSRPVSDNAEPSETSPADSSAVIRRVGALRSARSAHAATALANNRVLVSGGMRNGGEALKSWELFDANTNQIVAVGEMAAARVDHSATLLSDGRVLVAGGYNGNYLPTAELFDPATGRFTATGSMSEGRSGHTATLLADGTVLMTGGVGDGWSFLSTAEIYHPDTRRFTRVGSLRVPRESQTATLLRNGQVLITGGHRGRRENIEVYRSTEIYDPARRAFQSGPPMHIARHKHEAIGLADGRVLVVGGSDPRDRTRFVSTELYDPRTGAFSDAQPMGLRRYKLRGTAVQLPDNRVLVGGGARFAELYDPRDGMFRRVAGDFGHGYSFAKATLLATGDVLIIGGYDDGMEATAGVWRFNERRRSSSSWRAEYLSGLAAINILLLTALAE